MAGIALTASAVRVSPHPEDSPREGRGRAMCWAGASRPGGGPRHARITSAYGWWRSARPAQRDMAFAETVQWRDGSAARSAGGRRLVEVMLLQEATEMTPFGAGEPGGGRDVPAG